MKKIKLLKCISFIILNINITSCKVGNPPGGFPTSIPTPYPTYEQIKGNIGIKEGESFYKRSKINYGEIYHYKNKLFTLANDGINITDEDNANSKLFIEVPYFKDIAIKNDTLFVYSIGDLVTIDISKLDNLSISSISRTIIQENKDEIIMGINNYVQTFVIAQDLLYIYTEKEIITFDIKDERNPKIISKVNISEDNNKAINF